MPGVCECLVCVSMSGRRVNAGDISQDRLENDLLNNTLGTHRDPLYSRLSYQLNIQPLQVTA